MLTNMAKNIKLPLALIMSLMVAGACNAATNTSTVTTSYQTSSENFPNPERGFYPSVNPLGDNNPGYPLQLSELQKARSNNMSLVRRYYLLSAFRSQPISQSFLDMIAKDLETARKAGVKLIIRFTYNWAANGGPDAPADRVVSHLDQLKPILQNNYDAIAFVEAGFIGAWGEWHDSTNNLVDPWTLNVNDNSRKIFLKLLAVLPPERMVAVRYTHQKQELFNNNEPLTQAEAFNTSERARTGHHNDGFRASVDDGGTYGSTDPAIVEQEKSWLNLDNRYVVQSGEVAVSSDPPEYDDCSGALPDFARMHWSAMTYNRSDVEEVFQGWENQGCMNEIQRRLGYRFRLISSTLPRKVKPGNTFSMNFKVVNDGWASPYNPRSLEVILRNRTTGKEYYLPVAEAVRMWEPGVTKTVKIVGGIGSDMPAGEYQVLLNLPDPTSRLYNRPEYSIRFANQNVWEASTGYNSLLTNIVVDSNASGTTYSGNQLFKSR